MRIRKFFERLNKLDRSITSNLIVTKNYDDTLDHELALLKNHDLKMRSIASEPFVVTKHNRDTINTLALIGPLDEQHAAFFINFNPNFILINKGLSVEESKTVIAVASFYANVIKKQLLTRENHLELYIDIADPGTVRFFDIPYTFRELRKRLNNGQTDTRQMLDNIQCNRGLLQTGANMPFIDYEFVKFYQKLLSKGVKPLPFEHSNFIKDKDIEVQKLLDRFSSESFKNQAKSSIAISLREAKERTLQEVKKELGLGKKQVNYDHFLLA